MNEQEILTRLEEMELPVLDKETLGNTPELMRSLAEGVYEFNMSDIFVDLQSVKDLEAQHGVVVMYRNTEHNNGVYIFTVQENASISLMVVFPSTISTGPMIRRVSGDIVSAVTGVDTPLLTVFDKTEITGHVIVETVISPLMDMLNIPRDKREKFITLYLPRFMANVAQQYIGSSTLREETVEIEPNMVREMVTNEDLEKEMEELQQQKEAEKQTGEEAEGGAEPGTTEGREGYDETE